MRHIEGVFAKFMGEMQKLGIWAFMCKRYYRKCETMRISDLFANFFVKMWPGKSFILICKAVKKNPKNRNSALFLQNLWQIWKKRNIWGICINCESLGKEKNLGSNMQKEHSRG